MNDGGSFIPAGYGLALSDVQRAASESGMGCEVGGLERSASDDSGMQVGRMINFWLIMGGAVLLAAVIAYLGIRYG
jgi:hypothetical protein